MCSKEENWLHGKDLDSYSIMCQGDEQEQQIQEFDHKVIKL